MAHEFKGLNPVKSMFALVDCSNFYAFCEQVFNLKSANRPVIVLSNSNSSAAVRSENPSAQKSAANVMLVFAAANRFKPHYGSQTAAVCLPVPPMKRRN
jgi:nucleotidyltransferase/DNA polymerase involved in DNA repair